jgi:hypothetical protein
LIGINVCKETVDKIDYNRRLFKHCILLSNQEPVVLSKPKINLTATDNTDNRIKNYGDIYM